MQSFPGVTPQLRRRHVQIMLAFVLLLVWAPFLVANDVFSPADVLRTKAVTSAEISPNGDWIAFTVLVPRTPTDKAGGSYTEFYLVSTTSGEIRPFITGSVNIGSLAWRPDGSAIAFRTSRGEGANTQVWLIPVDGGEARQITYAETSVLDFRWHPSGSQIGYIAESPKNKRERALADKGYGFIYYEEDWKHRNLYLQAIDGSKAEQLTDDVTIWSFEFSADGKTIAAGASEKNLIDYQYAFQTIHLVDVASKERRQLTDNPRKLGNYAFSPDGKHLAFAAALHKNDNAVSQAFVIPVAGGASRNLTPADFRGHVSWVGWRDANTLLYQADEGVQTTLNTVPVAGGQRTTLLHSKDHGIIFSAPSISQGFARMAFTGQSPKHPAEVFAWAPGGDLKRLTTVNPWLENRTLGRQEAIRYKARDGMEIEGLLIYPTNYEQGKRYPLVVVVHGGPESHFSNRWITRYSEPGQALAGRGYAVFYPNYRASTGYGVKFAAYGFNDAAGVEFDDIADGIDHLVKIGVADKDRVGLGGGSYGGFAAAWFSSYYTKKVKAVSMFVGISNLISKRGTTDIPYEELFVHSGKKLEEMWDQSLKRSPIYHAHQSRTAVLILGGTADTRVDPSQSMEYYRRLKMNNHSAVRLVQYPGEGHGNRRQPGQIDVLHRILQWYDWYVKEGKPLDGPMPPLDISEHYGIELPE